MRNRRGSDPTYMKKPRDTPLDRQIAAVIDSMDRTARPPAGVAQGGRRAGRRGVFENAEGRLPPQPRGYYTETDFTLAGRGIANESTLFEIARAFGLPDSFGRNWDALADALSDLEEHAAPRLAVLWVDADASLRADLQAFLSAIVALAAAAEDLATADDPDRAKQLEVFVLGAGAGFPGA
jgi:RNAse (barnase) inhibitor barstar